MTKLTVYIPDQYAETIKQVRKMLGRKSFSAFIVDRCRRELPRLMDEQFRRRAQLHNKQDSDS